MTIIKRRALDAAKLYGAPASWLERFAEKRSPDKAKRLRTDTLYRHKWNLLLWTVLVLSVSLVFVIRHFGWHAAPGTTTHILGMEIAYEDADSFLRGCQLKAIGLQLGCFGLEVSGPRSEGDGS